MIIIWRACLLTVQVHYDHSIAQIQAVNMSTCSHRLPLLQIRRSTNILTVCTVCYCQTMLEFLRQIKILPA